MNNNYDNDDNDDNDEQRLNQEQEQESEILIPLTLDNTTGLTQFEIDVINVCENRVDINSFPKEYQNKIKNFYRFSYVKPSSNNEQAAGGSRSFWK